MSPMPAPDSCYPAIPKFTLFPITPFLHFYHVINSMSAGYLLVNLKFLANFTLTAQELALVKLIRSTLARPPPAVTRLTWLFDCSR